MAKWGSYDACPPKACARCGMEFTPSPRGRRALYCGQECRSRSFREHKKRYVAEVEQKAEQALQRVIEGAPRRDEPGQPSYTKFGRFVYGSLSRARATDVSIVEFNAHDLELRMSMFNFSCWICGGAFEAIDHVKPLKAGGAHMLSNLRPICATCNRRKWASWPMREVELTFTTREAVHDDFIATTRIASGFSNADHHPLFREGVDAEALRGKISRSLRQHEPAERGCLCGWRERSTSRGRAEHEALHIVKLLHREGIAS